MNQDSHSSTPTNYVTVWAVLILSLGALLSISTLGRGPLAVVLMVVLAVINATLMFAFFMHMAIEHRFVKWIVIVSAAVVLILLVSLVPDIVWMYGGKRGH